MAPRGRRVASVHSLIACGAQWSWRCTPSTVRGELRTGTWMHAAQHCTAPFLPPLPPFAAYSVAPNAAEEVEAWRAAIQEAIDELNPEAVAARKAKERVSEEIARKKDLTWRREEDKWDETRGMLGADATPSHLLTPMQRRLRQQLAEGMASGNLDFLAIVMAARSMVGRAYAWGSNDQGEAGIGRLAPAGMTGPAQIESLRRLHAPVFLAAGSKHAAALTGESQLFVWGRNMEGQCALGPKAKRSMRPYLVKGLKSFQVTHVACGHTHTVAVVSTGEAFAWGSSDSGALGIGPPTEEDEEAATKAAARGEDTSGEIVMTRHEPVRMVDIGPDFGRHAALVTAGRSTTAVQTAQGECLVCGSNSTGQLGFGIDQLGLTFHEVRPARLEGYSHIQQVELGDTFSAFVVDDGVLLLTGVLGVTPEEFAERRKETAWLIDNCDAPSPRTLFMERPLVRCIATSGEHLVVVCKYTDQHFAGGVVGNPSAPVATGSGDAAEPGVEELPPNDEQLFHVYTAGRGYLGCKPDHPDLTLLKNAGGVEVHLPDGSKALRDAVGEVVTPGFGWSPRLVPVPALQGQDIDEVACGDRFTLARTRDGRVFAWGDVRCLAAESHYLLRIAANLLTPPLRRTTTGSSATAATSTQMSPWRRAKWTWATRIRSR